MPYHAASRLPDTSMKPLAVVLLLPSLALAQGFTPADAVKRMTLPPGFTVTCVAAEPMIRQPLSIAHDDRGRLWVLQYLQYPNPAGLKPVRQDQYLRTVWDRVPEPPPKGPRGADRLTILSDPDETGVYRKGKDFISGLNLATGFCVGHGGVYIVQPPYLLFYPDGDGDDVPDTDTPDVLLTGFGMEDTHSYANSLQWGPDGWLYGAHGSTVTAKIKNPAFPDEPAVEFQQGVWRFHPRTRRFELFSEGGGNTYGLDFDRHGQVIAGTNYGGFAMLHQMQGAYYVKGFGKHGPLHNAHTYGYFDHVPYANFKGGHVTCGGIVYQGDTFPTEMHDQYVAGNLLSNAVYWHRLTPKGSSFTATHGGDLLVSNDTWCRPVDLTLGPDGSVYVADWYDKRAAHLDPIDNWDKTNGRVYRIDYAGTKRQEPFDLRRKSSAELCELLKHPNAWWRREARRLIAERQDKEAFARLRDWVADGEGQLPLEALWAQAAAGWVNPDYPATLFGHRDEFVRAWAVRLSADDPSRIDPDAPRHLAELAARESSPVVRAQLACTAKRLPTAADTVAVVRGLLAADAPADAAMPNLLWWAIEGRLAGSPGPAVALASEAGRHHSLLFRPLVEKVARRLMASDVADGGRHLAALLGAWSKAGDPEPVLAGIAAALDGGRADVDAAVRTALVALRTARPADDRLLTILARVGDGEAVAEFRRRVADAKRSPAERAKALDLLRQLHDPQAKPLALGLLTATADPLRLSAIGAAEGFDDPAIAPALLKGYPAWPAAVKRRAVQALASRKAWAADLLAAVDAGTVPAADVPTDQVRAVLAFNDPGLTKMAEKHYGKVGPATPGEKQARIAWLTIAVNNRKGDPASGHALFKQHCATCHTLFGEGNKVGPDLTAADRKNVGYMLAQIVDPSAVVRPEYVRHTVRTADGRTLSGLVVEATDRAVTLLDAQNRRTVVPRADVEEFTPTPVSLMPEKLLDALTDQQVADLFAHLRRDPPK
jgi:putative membrane-bound dehydrogenase-like protein